MYGGGRYRMYGVRELRRQAGLDFGPSESGSESGLRRPGECIATEWRERPDFHFQWVKVKVCDSQLLGITDFHFQPRG
jgi:hypothetical protein